MCSTFCPAVPYITHYCLSPLGVLLYLLVRRVSVQCLCCVLCSETNLFFYWSYLTLFSHSSINVSLKYSLTIAFSSLKDLFLLRLRWAAMAAQSPFPPKSFRYLFVSLIAVWSSVSFAPFDLRMVEPIWSITCCGLLLSLFLTIGSIEFWISSTDLSFLCMVCSVLYVSSIPAFLNLRCSSVSRQSVGSIIQSALTS